MKSAGTHRLNEREINMNVELFPASTNVYDSLAEAFMLSGDRDQAIANYRRSLELNPNNQNAKDMLQKLQDKTDSQKNAAGERR